MLNNIAISNGINYIVIVYYFFRLDSVCNLCCSAKKEVWKEVRWIYM